MSRRSARVRRAGYTTSGRSTPLSPDIPMIHSRLSLAGAAGLALLTLAACGDTTEERAATGALRGAATGAVLGGPVGAVVGAATGAATSATIGKVLDEAEKDEAADEKGKGGAS